MLKYKPLSLSQQHLECLSSPTDGFLLSARRHLPARSPTAPAPLPQRSLQSGDVGDQLKGAKGCAGRGGGCCKARGSCCSRLPSLLGQSTFWPGNTAVSGCTVWGVLLETATLALIFFFSYGLFFFFLLILFKKCQDKELCTVVACKN